MTGRLYTILLFVLLGINIGSAQWTIDTIAVKQAIVLNYQATNTKGNEFSPYRFGDSLLYLSDYNLKGKYNGNFNIYYLTKSGLKAEFQGLNTNQHEGPFTLQGHSLVFTLSSDSTIVLRSYNVTDQHWNKTPMYFHEVQVLHPEYYQGQLMIVAAKSLESPTNKLDLMMLDLSTGKVDKTLFSNINTEWDECFPRKINDEIIIFSSNRPGGNGKLDMYVSFLEDGIWSIPQVLPSPINSADDDMGLSYNQQQNLAYFNSNRPGGKGGDDIYTLKSVKPIFRKVTAPRSRELVITMLDILEFKQIPDLSIRVTELASQNRDWAAFGTADLQLIKTDDDRAIDSLFALNMLSDPYYTVSDSTGFAKLAVVEGKHYLIKVDSKGYEKQYLVYKADTSASQEFTIALSPEARPASEGMQRPLEKGQRFTLEGITFKNEKLEISSFAEDFLDDLAAAMIHYPSMLIQLISYTDARGNAVSNYRASQKRADAIKNYLTNKGVEALRVIAVGEGENKIVNRCIDGVFCEEVEHAVNNRIEILGIED